LQAETSSINFPATTSVANGVTVALSTEGKMEIYASQTTDVIFDATGFIA
jgi:siroheme synthase (precorrin-2 oxidase/ferrochelatase)